MTHEGAGWLSIDTREHAHATNRSKRTMVTLDRAAALALLKLLQDTLSA